MAEAMTWRENLVKKWAELKLADMALGMEMHTRGRHISEYAIRKAYEAVGRGETPEWPKPLEEDVSVTIGDTIHYHQTSGDTTTQSTPRPPAQPSGLSKLGTAALAAGALGVGVPAGMVASHLLRDDPPAITIPKDGLETGLTVERGGALRE